MNQCAGEFLIRMCTFQCPIPPLPVADCTAPTNLTDAKTQLGSDDSNHEDAIIETLQIQGMAPDEVSIRFWVLE